jgi:hypothetical protein
MATGQALVWKSRPCSKIDDDDTDDIIAEYRDAKSSLVIETGGIALAEYLEDCCMGVFKVLERIDMVLRGIWIGAEMCWDRKL